MFNALVDTAERLRTEKACARWFCLARAGRSAPVLDMGRFAAMNDGSSDLRDLSAHTASPIIRSRRCGAGGSCRCR
jgi:hypothetical protein